MALTGDTRKIFVSNIKTVDESHSARVLIACKPIRVSLVKCKVINHHPDINSLDLNFEPQGQVSFSNV